MMTARRASMRTAPTRLVATIILMVAGMVWPVAASAQTVDGKIVYECALDICVVNEDGTGLVNLTNSPTVFDIDPVWSPDGTRIAFSSDRTSVPTNADGNIEVFVMNADGSDVVQQTFTTTGLGEFVNSYEPTWNPNGTEIAFEGWRSTGFPEIIKIAVDGTGAETVLTNPGDSGSKFQPDWSPDGTRILFTWSLGQQDIHVINVDGSGETNLTSDTIGSDQRDGVWSPDGARFAFTDTRFWNIPDFNTEIFVRSADGAGEIQVTDHPSIDEEPTWSPDGTEIAFSSARGGSFDIWSAPVPAAGPAQLLAEPATQITSGTGDDHGPNWFGSGTSPATFTLSVVKAGSGSGTVTSTPTGINCGTDCSEAYTSGTSVTLTATPAAGSTFTGWSGACTGTGSCVVSMSQARSVTATFGLSGGGPFVLTVTTAGVGSVRSTPAGINCGTDCTESYASGTSVTLTPKPGRGSTFAGWSGACTGTGSCVVSMTEARTVTATFTGAGSTFTLSVVKAGSGSGTVTSTPTGINCGTDCSEAYTSGTSVTLTATPAAGSTFTGWSGACTGTGSCVVSMSQARSVTATFGLSGGGPFVLTVTTAGVGSVRSTPAGINCGTDCTESYASGTSVTLTPKPGRGSTFAGWSGACTGTGSCVVSMTEARTVTATFDAGVTATR